MYCPHMTYCPQLHKSFPSLWKEAPYSGEFSIQPIPSYSCTGIIYGLRTRSIIHRDIKPCIDADGHIVLGDYGISRDFNLLLSPSSPNNPLPTSRAVIGFEPGERMSGIAGPKKARL